MCEYATPIVSTATTAAATRPAVRPYAAPAEPPRGGDRADAERSDDEPRRQVRGPALPRLERREHVEQQRRVVEPVRVEPAAVHHPPRARDDALLVGVEQPAERQAVLDPDERAAPRRAPSIATRATTPAQTSTEARHRRGAAIWTSRADEHGVDAGALEGDDVVARRRLEVGDRELSGRDVGQQVEDPLEVVLVVLGLARREQEDLGVDPLERRGQRLLVVDVDDDLQPELGRAGVQLLEVLLLVVVLGDDQARVRAGLLRGLRRRVDAEEDGSAGRVPDALDGADHREALGARPPRPRGRRRRRARAR